MTLKKFIPFFAIIIALFSCEKGLDEPTLIIDVDDEYLITPVEVIAPGLRTIAFEVESIDNKSCENWTINYESTSDPVFWDIAISGFIEPLQCLGLPDKARAVIPFDSKIPNLLEIEFSINQTLKSQGTVNLKEREYAFNFLEDPGFEFIYTRLNKIPQNLVWGYIGTNSINLKDSVNSMQGQLHELGQTPQLTDGQYTGFRVVNNNINLDIETPDYFQVIQLGTQIGTINNLKAKIEELNLLASTDFELQLFAGDGTPF